MARFWSDIVQAEYQRLYYEENEDVFILKFNDPSQTYMATHRRTPIQMEILLNASTIVYYVSQRLKDLDVETS
jgi:hypothetical protein